jgi:NitT/TauT family transport system permease protein
MISLSGGWFFVVASEAITVSGQKVMLPGIGSYIALATHKSDVVAVFYAIITMFLIILIYDQLIFRPLIAWVDRFRIQTRYDENAPRSWALQIFRRMDWLAHCLRFAFEQISSICLFVQRSIFFMIKRLKYLFKYEYLGDFVFVKAFSFLKPYIGYSILLGCIAWMSIFFTNHFTIGELIEVVWLGCLTLTRVVVLISLVACFWLPVGVWIGLRPNAASFSQPIAQFLAAFPADILFPLAVLLILKFNLNHEIWTGPLMVLGAQWYFLINVIAGAAALPEDLRQAYRLMGVRGWLKWRKIFLPGMAPYLITGLVATFGGTWNASIVAETVHWGDITLSATGIGAYIAQNTSIGDLPRVALGLTVTGCVVLILNRLLWNPLYKKFNSRDNM